MIDVSVMTDTMPKLPATFWSRSLLTKPASEEVYAKGAQNPIVNCDKKVDMSLAEQDERFKPKVRTY